jgi:hypothetical protein
MRAVLSAEAVTTRSPWGSNAAAWTLSACDVLARGVERRGQDTSCVLQRLTDRRAGARIPDVGGVVVRGGDDALAREVERRGPDLGS